MVERGFTILQFPDRREPEERLDAGLSMRISLCRAVSRMFNTAFQEGDRQAAEDVIVLAERWRDKSDVGPDVFDEAIRTMRSMLDQLPVDPAIGRAGIVVPIKKQ